MFIAPTRLTGARRPAPLWPPRSRPWPWACLALVVASNVAQADDRPFLQTSNAVAEDDDEGNWALESWGSRVGPHRVFNIGLSQDHFGFLQGRVRFSGGQNGRGGGGGDQQAVSRGRDAALKEIQRLGAKAVIGPNGQAHNP